MVNYRDFSNNLMKPQTHATASGPVLQPAWETQGWRRRHYLETEITTAGGSASLSHGAQVRQVNPYILTVELRRSVLAVVSSDLFCLSIFRYGEALSQFVLQGKP